MTPSLSVDRYSVLMLSLRQRQVQRFRNISLNLPWPVTVEDGGVLLYYHQLDGTFLGGTGDTFSP